MVSAPKYMFFLDPAEAPVNVESNTARLANGLGRVGTRGGWPFRTTHHVNMATNETLFVLSPHAKSNGAVRVWPFQAGARNDR